MYIHYEPLQMHINVQSRHINYITLCFLLTPGLLHVLIGTKSIILILDIVAAADDEDDNDDDTDGG